MPLIWEKNHCDASVNYIWLYTFLLLVKQLCIYPHLKLGYVFPYSSLLTQPNVTLDEKEKCKIKKKFFLRKV